jgi:beta-galactosidase
MEKSMNIDKLTLGVCYYPEHWPENLWEDDLERMLDHGLEVIRIAEFAWNKFEPEEGVFTFDFFDRFLELAYKKGMRVIFCTPTATPPAWLTDKYPEVLNASLDGTLYRHGMRRHYNYNSLAYREFTKRIVDKLASHYYSHPAIIGWQIDNELNCEMNVFYSESDHKAFRLYMKDKFKTLDALNDAMGTAFWNQTYSSWEEIYLSRPNNHNSNNPHMALEEKRFYSKSTISFCKLQSDIIRKYVPKEIFITTNGIFGHVDSHEMTDTALDFITYDSYPNFAFDSNTDPKRPRNMNDRNWSRNLSKVRSISPNFGIMEQQSGPGGWDFRIKQPSPKPGQMRLWTFQSIAHGADFISYFRWRTSWIGTEIYWHGLNDYSNEPNRRLTELKSIHNDIIRISNIAGARYTAQIAMVKDYDNEWDGEQDQWHGPLDKFSDNGWFTAAQITHTPMDYVFLRNSEEQKTSLKDLEKYKLLIYPHPTIFTQDTADLLKAYVRGGGKLIMGARTGYKDIYGRCPMRPMPGFASDICGVKVIDYTHLGPDDGDEFAIWDDEIIEAPVFNDILEATEDAEVLAVFKGNYYNRQPALVSKNWGKGTAYYFGAGFSPKTAEVFLRKMNYVSPYEDVMEIPEEVELAVRSKNEEEYLILLNYKPYSVQVLIKEPVEDLLTGELMFGSSNLNKFGVMILKRK